MFLLVSRLNIYLCRDWISTCVETEYHSRDWISTCVETEYLLVSRLNIDLCRVNSTCVELNIYLCRDWISTCVETEYLLVSNWISTCVELNIYLCPDWISTCVETEYLLVRDWISLVSLIRYVLSHSRPCFCRWLLHCHKQESSICKWHCTCSKLGNPDKQLKNIPLNNHLITLQR